MHTCTLTRRAGRSKLPGMPQSLRFGLFAAVLAVNACGQPRLGPIPPASTGPEADVAVSVHKLANGLTVYVSPEPSEPRVSAWIAFRNGSRHDPPNSTGLAHYLEHMLFKGSAQLGTMDFASEKAHIDGIADLYAELAQAPATERASILKSIDQANAAAAKLAIPNELDQLYGELGITGVNAFTGEDMTVYIADVPSNRFEAWARVEGDRYQSPVFRLFYPELETVYEEKNRSLDSPGSRIYEAMLAGLYPKHPYGTQPTIGTVEHLKTPAYGDMVDYFNRWYVPNNAAIVLSGDIDAARALPIIEKYFGSWSNKPLSPPNAGQLQPLSARVERTVSAPGEESVTIAWPTIPAGHADELALEVMDLLVDNESTGLLNLDLLLTQKLPRAGSGPEFMVEAGYWQLRGTARSDQNLAQVENMLMRLVAKLRGGEFSQADIDAIIVNQEISHKLELESRKSRVAKMAFAFLQNRKWSDVTARLQQLRRITKADIVRVANRYLGEGRVVVLRKRGEADIPSITKPSITAFSVEAGRRSPFATDIAAMGAEPVSPRWVERGRDFEQKDTSAGTITAVANPINDLFTISHVFNAGYRAWPLICIALKVADAAGTAQLDATAFKRRLYSLGTKLEFSCSRDRTVITMSGIDRNLEASRELLASLLTHPRFTADRLTKVVNNEVSKRRDRLGEPRFIAAAAAEFASFGTDSRFLLAPSNRLIKAATAGDIRSAVAKLMTTQHRTTYFGPRKLEGATLALGDKHTRAPARPIRRFRKPEGVALYVTPHKVAQSNISLVFPGPELGAEDEVWAELYSEYVGGGMGALIFQEIREARGLAYSAWGSYDTGTYRGDQPAARGQLGTQVDKTIEALAKMLELLPAPPIEANRLQLAKASLLRRTRTTRVQPRQIAAQVLAWEDRGFDRDPRKAMFDQLQTATTASLEKFVDKIKTAAAMISMVTDQTRVTPESLKRFGKVTVTPVKDLVSYDD